MQYVTLEDTVYFYFAVNTTSGNGSDGDVAGTGTGSGEAYFVVREGGAGQSASPTYTGWPILLTHASYPNGCYEVALPATAANGFAANKTYAVFCTLTVSNVNPTGYVGSFRTAPVPANTVQWLGTAPATPTTGGVPEVDITHWRGDAVPATTVAGVPEVDITHSLGTALQNEDFTLAEATASTITLPATDSAGVTIPDNGQYEYCVFEFVGGTAKNQIVLTTTAVAGTATTNDREYNVLTGTMPAQPDSTTKVVFLGTWRSNVVMLSGDATAADNLESYTDGTTPMPVNVTQFGGSAGTFSSGRPEVNASHWGGTAVGSTEVRANLINIAGSAVNTSSAQLGVNVVNAAGTAWNSGAIGAATIATDAIDADALAATAVSEIQSGLATAANQTTIIGYIDTEVAAIKAKTDQLTFTASGRVDCQVYGMQANSITASALATDAAQEVADTVLGRSVSATESTAAEHSLCSIILGMLESSVSGTTWTIKRTDGTTTHLTKTLTTASGTDPITGVS